MVDEKEKTKGRVEVDIGDYLMLGATLCCSDAFQDDIDVFYYE